MKAKATENVPEKKRNREGKVGVKNMLFWQSRSISLGANLMITGFLSIYCTDTLKMPAALVGILLMASKIIDGFTDIFAGYFVDKTNTKIGRGRPYEIAIIGVWLCTWLMFSCPPEFSLFAKSAWVLSMYIFVFSVFATLLNAGETVYMVRAFSRQEQYVAIRSYGSIITMLCVVAVNVSFPMLMAKLATSAKGWSALLAIYAVPLVLIGLLRFIFIKETNNVDVSAGEKLRLKDVLTVLKTNSHFYVICIITVIFNFITNMGIGSYYFTYVVKDVGLMGPMALIQVIVIPLVFLLPPLLKKYSTVEVIRGGLVFYIIGYLINFFAYDRIPLLVAGQIFIGLGAIPISMFTVLLIIDCAEYNEWKKQPRLEGTLSSMNGFTAKVGAAFGAGVMGVLLSVAGYTGSAETVPASAITMIRMLYSLIPLALYIILIIALRFYKLDKMMSQIRRENEENRKAALDTPPAASTEG
jgi:probable glucitol transport protein GutA